jgi:hypothetical protein
MKLGSNFYSLLPGMASSIRSMMALSQDRDNRDMSSTRSSIASEVGSARVEELSTTDQGEAAIALTKGSKKRNKSTAS